MLQMRGEPVVRVRPLGNATPGLEGEVPMTVPTGERVRGLNPPAGNLAPDGTTPS